MTGAGATPSLEDGAWRPDVVHVHNTFPNWGTQWIRQWGPRTVVTMHNFRTVCAAATLFRDGHVCHDCLARPVLPAIRHKCYRDSRLHTVPLALASAPGGGLRRLPTSAKRLIALNSDAQQLFRDTFGKPVDLIPNFVDAVDASGAAGRGRVELRRTPDPGEGHPRALALVAGRPRPQRVRRWPSGVRGAGRRHGEPRPDPVPRSGRA